jgi:AraC family transcriptional regulator of adaptative response / DNA-3-methyladenine glycosylase II
VSAVVHRSGFGATRLFELFRRHYHTTPADFLLRARLEATRTRLAETDEPISTIAYAAGFETLSVFHENFRRLNGLTPAAYRKLRDARTFSVALPGDYPLGYLRRALSRDPHSVTEHFEGDTYRAGVWLDATPAVLTLQLGPRELQVAISAGSAFAAHALVVGLVGLEQDSAAFVRAVRKLGLARLVAGRAGLRISQTPSVFDGVLWAIIGQQINFPFACLLKRRLIERTSRPIEDGLYVPPPPEAVAQLEPADLLPLQFSRQKANYLVSTARLVASGQLDLAGLRTMSATRAERTLLAVHGLGPWSVNYLLMRSLGFLDCVPLGDTGVTSGLQSLFSLDHRPDRDETLRLMRGFAPYRSLATTHLWQLDRPLP